jgi:hypothetical protein
VEDEVSSLRDRIVERLNETQNLILATQFRDEVIMQLVERHGPVADDYLDMFSLVCTVCSDPEEGRWTMYPCAELQMIAQMLGVDPTG